MHKVLNKTSRDYNLLYDLLCDNYKVPCYLQTKENPNQKTVMECVRYDSFQIICSYPGHCGFSIHKFENKNNISEKDLLILKCTQADLEFILPSI